MSETAEREMELVAGVIGGITQKKADTWTVQVTPPGSNFAKNLWTKDADLVESLAQKIGQEGAFVGSLGAPYTVQGKEVRSWWIDSAAESVAEASIKHSLKTGKRVATPSAAPKAVYERAGNKIDTRDDGMSKEEWRRKDRAADRRACIAIAASALQHTMPSDPSTEDLTKFNERVKYLSRNWHLQVEAVRNEDDSDAPFLSEADDSIPY